MIVHTLDEQEIEIEIRPWELVAVCQERLHAIRELQHNATTAIADEQQGANHNSPELQHRPSHRRKSSVIGAPASWKTGLSINGELMEDSFPMSSYAAVQDGAVLTEVSRKLSVGLPPRPTEMLAQLNPDDDRWSSGMIMGLGGSPSSFLRDTSGGSLRSSDPDLERRSGERTRSLSEWGGSLRTQLVTAISPRRSNRKSITQTELMEPLLDTSEDDQVILRLST